MTRDLEVRATKYAETFIPVHRIGLNIDQVQAHHLAANPTKTADRRAEPYIKRFGNFCWELDALPPDVLREMVRTAIEAFIDVSVWKTQIEIETREHEQVRIAFNHFERVLQNII
jgi:hypothetical protein